LYFLEVLNAKKTKEKNCMNLTKDKYETYVKPKEEDVR
jgi:hypothetical protein